jgi:uncharacterized protein (DUF983 family)
MRPVVAVARALRLRCPHCGARWPMRHWIEPAPACRGCGLHLDRGESDYWLGAYFLNLVAAELFCAAAMLALLAVTWPDPPWRALLWGGIPVLVVVPFLTFPATRLLWLAVDLMFRPVRPDDFGPEMPEEARTAQ